MCKFCPLLRQNPLARQHNIIRLQVPNYHTADYRRLPHMNMKEYLHIHKFADVVPPLQSTTNVCGSYRLARAHTLPFHGHFKRSTSVGGIVHSDIAGEIYLSYHDRFRYLSPFLYDYSRYTCVAFLLRKSDIEEAFNIFLQMIPNMGKNDIGVIESPSLLTSHSDNAKEYEAVHSDFGETKYQKVILAALYS